MPWASAVLAGSELAERDPAAATEVWRKVLARSEFDWTRDGEALLRQYKLSWFDKPALPALSLVSERVASLVAVNS